MTTGIILPEFDPFLISFGGFGIRWYALAYIVGLMGGYWILRREAQRAGPIDVAGIESLLNHVLLGVILGGRMGFVLFYQPGYYLANPLEILKIWQGGMAFHGGLAGVILAMWLFRRVAVCPFSPSATGWPWSCRSAFSLGGCRISSMPSFMAA